MEELVDARIALFQLYGLVGGQKKSFMTVCLSLIASRR
jgi:hypothetical protein